MQYEQYEQEMKHLQQLIEEAHREIGDKPVATSNIQELQAQISRHEVRWKWWLDWGLEENAFLCPAHGVSVPG